MQAWRATCSKPISDLLAYWEGKCAGRRMPSRSDIDPAEMIPFLPSLMLVDVVGDERRFVYRLAGTREVEVRGRDPTGKSVEEAFLGASVGPVLARYEAVRTSGEAHYVGPDQSQKVSDQFTIEEILRLPLSEDGETVNMIMVFSVNRDLYKHRD